MAVNELERKRFPADRRLGARLRVIASDPGGSGRALCARRDASPTTGRWVELAPSQITGRERDRAVPARLRRDLAPAARQSGMLHTVRVTGAGLRLL